jgi:hypothetical protein
MTLLPPESLTDEQLLQHCRWEAFRASGPGGQKRNKTSSAIRITHVATGISAIANESRSQSVNRRRALERLRHRLVIQMRHPIDLEKFVRPKWFEGLLIGRRLDVGKRDERYLAVMNLVLDVFAASEGSISDTASALGITTANLVRFFRADEKLWAQVNEFRAGAGLKSLG